MPRPVYWGRQIKEVKMWYLFRWLGSFLGIIDDFFMIITLGFWSPSLCYRLAMWNVKNSPINNDGNKGNYLWFILFVLLWVIFIFFAAKIALK